MTTENSVAAPAAVAPGAPATPASDTGQVPTPTNPPGAAASAQQKDMKLSDLPESWQKEISDLRKENAAYRTAQKEAADAKAAEDEENLKKKQEWEALYNKSQQELNTLKTYKAQAEEATQLLTKHIDAEIAKWPEAVTKTKPTGEGVTAKILSDWLESHRPIAEQLLSATASPPLKRPVQPGNPAGPTPANNNRPAGQGATQGETLIQVQM